jgi:hypothetical protein
MNLKKYKIIDVETSERIHDFLAVDDKEAIILFDKYVKRICDVHGKEQNSKYVLKEELDEFNERTVKKSITIHIKLTGTKKVFYNKQEVVFYYTSGLIKDGKQIDTWINIIVKGGKRIELRGKAAVKLLKRFITLL